MSSAVVVEATTSDNSPSEASAKVARGLLHLSPELRIAVYKHLFPPKEVRSNAFEKAFDTRRPKRTGHGAAAILSTCRLIRSEARAHLYENTIFLLTFRDVTSMCWAEPNRHYVRLIRHLRIIDGVGALIRRAGESWINVLEHHLAFFTSLDKYVIVIDPMDMPERSQRIYADTKGSLPKAVFVECDLGSLQSRVRRSMKARALMQDESTA